MITYKDDQIPSSESIVELYRDAGLQRPLIDLERITKMYQHSDIVVTAWDKNDLIGIARSITDFCYSCYLADLAVRKSYQGQGVAKNLVNLTKNIVGIQTTLLLLSSDNAIDFYKKIGFEHIPHKAFMIKRMY